MKTNTLVKKTPISLDETKNWRSDSQSKPLERGSPESQLIYMYSADVRLMVCFETANHFYLSHKSSIRALFNPNSPIRKPIQPPPILARIAENNPISLQKICSFILKKKKNRESILKHCNKMIHLTRKWICRSLLHANLSKDYENLRAIGEKQIPHLPLYLQSCDVGMQMWHLSSLL